jgi:hypothetical protein
MRPIHRILVPEYPIDAIPRVARQARSAIVVLGAISRSGLKRLFIGNTAERLLPRQLQSSAAAVRGMSASARPMRDT